MSACPSCGTEMSFYKSNDYGDESCSHHFEVEGELLREIVKQKERENANCTTLSELIIELKFLVDSLKNKSIYR